MRNRRKNRLWKLLRKLTEKKGKLKGGRLPGKLPTLIGTSALVLTAVVFDLAGHVLVRHPPMEQAIALVRQSRKDTVYDQEKRKTVSIVFGAHVIIDDIFSNATLSPNGAAATSLHGKHGALETCDAGIEDHLAGVPVIIVQDVLENVGDKGKDGVVVVHVFVMHAASGILRLKKIGDGLEGVILGVTTSAISIKLTLDDTSNCADLERLLVLIKAFEENVVEDFGRNVSSIDFITNVHNDARTLTKCPLEWVSAVDSSRHDLINVDDA